MIKKFTIANVLVTIIGILIFIAVSFRGDAGHSPIKFFDENGEIFKLSRIFITTKPVTTGNGFSIDMSAAGFTNIISYYATVVSDRTDANTIPYAEIKTVTASSITLNIMEGNQGVVGVLSGVQFLQDTTGVKVSVCIIGN